MGLINAERIKAVGNQGGRIDAVQPWNVVFNVDADVSHHQTAEEGQQHCNRHQKSGFDALPHMADAAGAESHADTGKAADKTGEQYVEKLPPEIHVQNFTHIENADGDAQKLKKYGGKQRTGKSNALWNR